MALRVEGVVVRVALDRIEVVGCSAAVGLGLACFVEGVGLDLVLVVQGVLEKHVGVRGIVGVGIVTVDPVGEVGLVVEETVATWALVLEGTAVGVDCVEVVELAEGVGQLMVEIEAVPAGVVCLRSRCLVMSLVLMSTVPWKVVLMMGVYGCTYFVKVGVDLGMT